MSDHHDMPSEDKILILEDQQVVIDDFEADGLILDIGGGGEGIIGKLKGDQVVAIDTSLDELKESAPGPLKIVMDATELNFIDESFQTVTALFSFMFIETADHQHVFNEVFRVLKPGGKFLIWEAELEPITDPNKEIVAFPLRIKLPNEEITTGYGTPSPPHKTDIRHYLSLAQNAGFVGKDFDRDKRVFRLILSKP